MNVDKRILLVLILVALLGTGIGGYFYFPTSPISYPTPPEINVSSLEPAVAALLQKMRQQVLDNPASSETWGRLGTAFLLNDLPLESRICLAEAERLDPNDPHWPYSQANILVARGDLELGLPYMRRTVELLKANKDPTISPTLLLAETLMALGRYDEAETRIRGGVTTRAGR